ncbi:hypothetical protein ABIF65_000608 [Bradyrhizobium japonicum]|nr:hypothetical protein [Bradyrhizobium japonicum]MCP1856797.1 hypothetical protein [Bradyrhizobium japonicum]MCP1887612.1 hypothetical protein [Bradyrhizobium japonicum]MCW2320583.1 hypothetical protein [Bradyrhizobium japonicum]
MALARAGLVPCAVRPSCGLAPAVCRVVLMRSAIKEPVSIGQVERLIGADVDAGGIRRLAVVESYGGIWVMTV